MCSWVEKEEGTAKEFFSGSLCVSEEQAKQWDGAMAQGCNVKILALLLWKCSSPKETHPLSWARPDWTKRLHQEAGFLESKCRGLPWQGGGWWHHTRNAQDVSESEFHAKCIKSSRYILSWTNYNLLKTKVTSISETGTMERIDEYLQLNSLFAYRH